MTGNGAKDVADVVRSPIQMVNRNRNEGPVRVRPAVDSAAYSHHSEELSVPMDIQTAELWEELRIHECEWMNYEDRRRDVVISRYGAYTDEQDALEEAENEFAEQEKQAFESFNQMVDVNEEESVYSRASNNIHRAGHNPVMYSTSSATIGVTAPAVVPAASKVPAPIADRSYLSPRPPIAAPPVEQNRLPVFSPLSEDGTAQYYDSEEEDEEEITPQVAYHWLSGNRHVFTLAGRNAKEYVWLMTKVQDVKSGDINYQLAWCSVSGKEEMQGNVLLSDVVAVNVSTSNAANFSILLSDTPRALKNSGGRSAVGVNGKNAGYSETFVKYLRILQSSIK